MPAPSLTDLERELALALHRGDHSACIAMLRTSELVVPISEAAFHGRAAAQWATVNGSDERTTVLAYTSPELMQEATSGALQFARRTTLAGLASAWPDNRWTLTINPATPLAFELEAGYIARLVAPDLDMQMHATPEMPFQPVQKAIRVELLESLLASTRPRISGYIHKYVDVARFGTPREILAAIGIGNPVPYLTAEDELFVARWIPSGTPLYPSSIGGRDADQMAAVDGWIIDDSPGYIGLGLAPNPDSMVQEYRVSALMLPHAAEICRVDSAGQYQRRAVYDAIRQRWLLVRTTDEIQGHVPAEVALRRQQYLAELEDVR